MGCHHWPPAQILDMDWVDILYAQELTARFNRREAEAIAEAVRGGK